MDWSLDPNGAARHMSREWLEFTGTNEEEIVGARPTPCVHPNDFANVAELIKEAAESTSPFILTFRLRRADNSYSWVIAGGAPSFSPANGEVLGYLGKTELLDDGDFPHRVLNVLKTPRVIQKNTHQIRLIDAIADHVIMARNIAKHSDDMSIKRFLDFALLTIGDILYKSKR